MGCSQSLLHSTKTRHCKVPIQPYSDRVFILNKMSKSKLERLVYNTLLKEYPHLKVKHNTRPVWMRYKDGTRLELDFYIPYLKVAIEVQGRQHYEFVKFFHRDESQFKKRKEYDDYKRFACLDRGVELYEISNKNELRIALLDIKKRTEFSKAKKFYLPSELKKWKHNGIKRFITLVLYGKYQLAIKKFNSINSILLYNKEPVLTISDIRKYQRVVFPSIQSLFSVSSFQRKVDEGRIDIYKTRMFMKRSVSEILLRNGKNIRSVRNDLNKFHQSN